MLSLSNKRVSNRRSRPTWVMDDQQLMLRAVGADGMIRFKVAQMYWRNNMTAQAIAAELNLSLGAVKMILTRMRKSNAT